jgi:hypothetical protein
MCGKIVLAAVSCLVLAAAPASGTDITVVPTLPPGIGSVLTSGGFSALNTNTGTYTLGGNSTTFYISTLLLLPLLVAVVALDFGIFGAYATRREELNPVSQFVFNVREGFNVVRSRQGGPNNKSQKQRFAARYSKDKIVCLKYDQKSSRFCPDSETRSDLF